MFESVSKTRAPYAGDVLQEHHGVEIKKTVCAIKCVQHQCIIVHQWKPPVCEWCKVAVWQHLGSTLFYSSLVINSHQLRREHTEVAEVFTLMP